MLNVTTILADVKTLSDYDKERLFNAIGEIITLSSYAKNLTQEIRESPFSKGTYKGFKSEIPNSYTDIIIFDFQNYNYGN